MITLTESAANHIKTSIAKRGKGIGIRLTSKSSGCSGLSSVIEFCDETKIFDTTYIQHDVTVAVDAENFPIYDGSTVDYVKQGLNEGFEITNPNVKDECGCKKSFNI